MWTDGDAETLCGRQLWRDLVPGAVLAKDKTRSKKGKTREAIRGLGLGLRVRVKG